MDSSGRAGGCRGAAASLSVQPWNSETLSLVNPLRVAAAAVLSLILTALPPPTGAQVPALRQVAKEVARQGPFMGVLRVEQGERRLLDAVHGQADLEAALPLRATARLRIGSVTKQFTAAALLRLQDQGKLAIDDPLHRHWPEAPAAWAGITLAQLLTHQSGIPNGTNLPDFATFKRLPEGPEQSLRRVAALPLDFAPGAGAAYSNSAYVLAGWLVERISGLPLGEFLQREFFGPLGLRDTALEAPEALLPRRAQGYRATEGGGWQRAAFIDMRQVGGAGALVSSVGDLLRWQRALHGGQVLRPASLARMRTPVGGRFAMGLIVADDPQGGRRYEHSGGIDGFSAWLQWRERDRLGIVVLSNVEGAPMPVIGARLLRAVDGGWHFDAQPVLLRGSFNAWGADDVLKRQPGQPARWMLERTLPAGTHDFKIASADWAQVDLGGRRPGQHEGALAEQGANLQLRSESEGRWRFTLSLDARRQPQLQVQALR